MAIRASWLLALVCVVGLLGPAILPAPVVAQPATEKRPSPPWLTRDELRAKYADEASRMMTIGGVEVHYKDEGSGPAVLLIHGSISTLKTWDGVADDLKKNYRVIRYDIPPFGLSSSVPDTVASSLKPVDVAEQLLRDLGVSKVIVVGVSSGGTQAVQLAARRPDLVEHLVLSNAPSDPLPPPPSDPSKMSPAYFAAQQEEKRLGYRTPNYWKAWFGRYSPNFRGSPAFLEHIYDMNRREPEANITALVAKVADADAAMKAMNGVKAPTLLLWGGADPLLTVEAMDKLGSYLIQASVSKLVMPDVGHYPPMEVPQRYAKLVRAYVENATPVGDLKLRLSRQITGAITVAVIPKLQWKIQVDSDSDATNFGSHAGLQDQPQDRVEAARELDALLLSAPTTDDPAYQRGRSHEPDA